MNISDVTNRQHYLPTDHFAPTGAPQPVQYQSSSLCFGGEPRGDGLGGSGRPSANTPMVANAADCAPSKGGGFFGKLFGAIGSVFSAISKSVSSIVGVLEPLISTVAPFFGPVGAAVSSAVSMAGQALRFASDKVESAMTTVRGLFKI